MVGPSHASFFLFFFSVCLSKPCGFSLFPAHRFCTLCLATPSSPPTLSFTPNVQGRMGNTVLKLVGDRLKGFDKQLPAEPQ